MAFLPFISALERVPLSNKSLPSQEPVLQSQIRQDPLLSVAATGFIADGDDSSSFGSQVLKGLLRGNLETNLVMADGSAFEIG